MCGGRLCRQKGQDQLLAVWPAVRAALPDARLVLVGAGPAARLPGVSFAGTVADVRPWYAAAELRSSREPPSRGGKRLNLLYATQTGVRPPRCVSKLGVDRPGLLVSIAMVAVTD